MTPRTPIQKPNVGAATALQLEDLYQVVLFNDDHHSMEFVVMCLMRTFKHSAELAAKIMLEAHARGRAIAEVEGEEAAQAHCGQLQSQGLMARIEQ
jgi:ATP-dependent Clp protease adapter protein ClpS